MIKNYGEFVNENYKRINEEGEYLKITYKGGGLQVSLQPGLDEIDIENIIEQVKKNNGYFAFYELFEDISANSSLLYFDDASDIGQMSDKPVIVYDADLGNDGWELTDYSKLFVYDNIRKSPTEKLLDDGYINFKYVN